MFFGNGKRDGGGKVQHFDNDSENKCAIDEVETGYTEEPRMLKISKLPTYQNMLLMISEKKMECGGKMIDVTMNTEDSYTIVVYEMPAGKRSIRLQLPVEVEQIMKKLEEQDFVVISRYNKGLYLQTKLSVIKSKAYDDRKCFLLSCLNDWEYSDIKGAKLVVLLYPFSKEFFYLKNGNFMFSIMKDYVKLTTADDKGDKMNVLCTDQAISKKWDIKYNHRMGEEDTIVAKSKKENSHGGNQKEGKQYKWKDWAKCAHEKDVNAANKLLNDDILPNKEELQLVLDHFISDCEGKELLKDICQKIENHLMETDKKIEYVKGCFKHEDPGTKIIFVIQTTLESAMIDCPYTSYVIEQHMKRTSDEMEIENFTRYPFNEIFTKANECLRINSPGLMESHSNLTGTSLGTINSTLRQDPENTICIVLYVEAKGYVPVGEELLPSHLKYDRDTVFKTDVREGQCAIATAGPFDKHEDLKSGCRIESTKVPDGGTLGGFINHPDHGMCFMTCSHVLLTVEEFEKTYKGQLDAKTLHETQCFQPQQPDICGKVCDVRLLKGNEYNGGMDIAFCKVDESRKPKTTSFPDIFADDGDENRKIPPIIDHLLLQALQYDPRSVIQNSMQMKEQMKVNNQVVKYGCKSKLTSGTVQCLSSSQRFQMYGHFFTDGRNARQKSKKLKYILNDQIQILDDCGSFSDKGDSGSMVFVTNEHKELMALGILTGRVDETKTTFVTPIWNILKEIQMPRPYTLAEPRSTQMVIEELKRTAFLITGKCEALVKILEH